ncbi:effector-associated constant component EACC1 [Acrocarpospora catenulata]|uniref:effector-associated constant component EACC1 n=1 Tax=Acrocarpospora catenulata TaxID=2836182 RepID=UPI001BDA04AB|nr:hypothetical protein [Acrocarpospora catenulata]
MQLKVGLVAGPEADPQEIADLGRELRKRLLEWDADEVEPERRPAPEGSKAVDAATWETLLVTFAASGGVLTTIIAGINAWVARRQTSTSVTIEINGNSLTLPTATEEERRELIQAFVKSLEEPDRE